jgi:hypothetical protein
MNSDRNMGLAFRTMIDWMTSLGPIDPNSSVTASLAGDVSRIDQISIFAAFTMPKRKRASQQASF